MFDIDNTLSFNTDKLVDGNDYDYVTRTSINQGILRSTGFINKENINNKGVWSLGLLQMDFFYRNRKWYAGQFVRKITPKINLTSKAIPFFTTVLNCQKPILLSVLVRDVDDTFKKLKVQLPTKDGKIDFDFMETFITELEAERVAKLKAYLKVCGFDNYELTDEEEDILSKLSNGSIDFQEIEYKTVFNKIQQGRRLKKSDQLPGNIPFVMSGRTNCGVVDYISNPVVSFPSNSITVDIFGNTFYRGYGFGAGDDTGVYWSDKENYSKEEMLFYAAAIEKSLVGKFSYGKKLRSSVSHNFKMYIPMNNGTPDSSKMKTIISAIQKLVIKDVVTYTDRKIKATKEDISAEL